MSGSVNATPELRRHAREIFLAALEAVDANRAVRRAARLDDSLLTILDAKFDLRRYESIYAVALGKAAGAMAVALDSVLGDRLAGGILSSSSFDASLSPRWLCFTGGHPLPNEASFAAARACFDLLNRADHETSLVIFLVSGGGSAMMELPRDELITLYDVQKANRTLVSCGAKVGEINKVRQAFSRVKAGGLSRSAPRADQVTLIVSDTNAGEESNVASGPTFERNYDARDALSIIARYDLERSLPPSVIEAINRYAAQPFIKASSARRHHYVLLDNRVAVERAAKSACERSFRVFVDEEIIEQRIEEGSAKLVTRLFELCRQSEVGETVCLISGGEFACPVRGNGGGGRNSETALRFAIEIHKRLAETNRYSTSFVALSAGTDGIDGNSPAAGALATDTTIKRARELNLDGETFLHNSDAYNFFRLLGDEIITGATGTNARDLRIMLAKKVSSKQ